MTDNYQFAKSNLSEGVDSYSPFTDKQWNYLNDINSGVYQNSGLTLVQWDLSSIYNSSKFSDLSECYVTLPIVLTAGIATGANPPLPIAPIAGSFSLLSMKSNFVNLIHQGDLQVSGSSVEQTQPFLNVFQNFRMLSEMSQNDLKSIGTSLGFSQCVDTPSSTKWNGAVSNAGLPTPVLNGGNGLCNNFPFPIVGSLGSDSQQAFGTQNVNVVNKAIQERVGRYYDVSNNTTNNIIGAGGIPTSINAGNIMTPIQLNNEFKPYYQVLNTNYMVWYDVAVIRLGDIFDSMKQLGMLKRFDGILRLYVNTGGVQVNVAAPTADTTYQFQYSNSTFTNTIPFTVNYVRSALPATTATITAGCYIARPAQSNFNTAINLSASGASHPMNACRFYYSQITMSPEKSLKYIESNRNKEIVYRTILSNNYSNTTAGSSFNQLINAGIKNLIGVLIIPYIASSLLLFPEYASPFDTFGSTYCPISLINVQASVGGTNLKANPEIYTFENFLNEVKDFESLTSSDFGVSVGLINQQWWEQNRCYYLSCRSTDADKATPRALNISFVNNSQVPIDVMVFTIYLDRFVVDVSSGIIKK
jgi:hypothetical protein